MYEPRSVCVSKLPITSCQRETSPTAPGRVAANVAVPSCPGALVAAPTKSRVVSQRPIVRG
jgi:hypothetical protein